MALEKNNKLNLKNPLHLYPLGMLFILLPWYSQLAIIFFIAILSYCSTKSILDIIGFENRKVIVCDEFMGMLITVFMSHSWSNVFLAFFVFSFFDILKLWPSKLITTKYPNALGEILDDVVSGVYSLVVMLLLNTYIFF